jgi:hypothetical protein
MSRTTSGSIRVRSSSLRSVLQQTSRGMECRSHFAARGVRSDSADVSAQRGSDAGLALGSLRPFSLTEGAEDPLAVVCPIGTVGAAMREVRWGKRDSFWFRQLRYIKVYIWQLLFDSIIFFRDSSAAIERDVYI